MAKTRDILSSPRVEEIKRTKKKAMIRNSILYFLLAVFVVVGLSFLSSYKKMTINNIKIVGNKILSSEEIENVINENLAGKYLYLFSKKNAFIYPHDRIYDGLLSHFTRIEKLSLDVKNVNTLEVFIKERSGLYMWCGENIPLSVDQMGDNCYFINDSGYIFDHAPYVSGNLYFKYFIPIPDTKNILGSSMMDEKTFRSFVRLIDDISMSGLEPSHLTYVDDEVYIYLSHKDGATNPYIMIKKDADFKKLGDDISVAMSQAEFKDEVLGKYDNLLYIDMRFDDKVFYKFQ